ncbi:alpha-ketoacid dehydrogenase kinase [Neoconidiobolus thromboides FSU 785]|nr:alpha-ketoacid dehydrogenase kinase [Neoconidiobolus thromboides FSU 785]
MRLRVIPTKVNKITKGLLATNIIQQTRSYKSPQKVVSFYDQEVPKYGSKNIGTVRLQDLLQFGRPPLEQEKLIQSGQYTLNELTPRLAKRVLAFQSLPYIVGLNPHLSTVYKLYYDSFETLRRQPSIYSAEQDKKFTEQLLNLVESHADVIPKLAQGFRECQPYLKQEEIDNFLNEMIRARISIRLIAEQHLALHQESHPDYVGIMNTKLSPYQLFKSVVNQVSQICEVNYGESPEVIYDGHTDAKFKYAPIHLEYIAIELLKNAFRATVECYQKKKNDDREMPPVAITFSQEKSHICIRIRDQGGGIPSSDLKNIFKYSYTTVPSLDNEDDSIFSVQSKLSMQAGIGGPMAGLGYGLPMTKVYAEYFGGGLELQSLEGYGTDVFLILPNIQEEHYNLEI